jgi:hypothetical protein
MARCTDPRDGSLLHAYEVGALSPADFKRFEIHLLKCAQCFERVKQFQAEAELLVLDDDVKETVRKIDKSHSRQESWIGRLGAYVWPKAPFVFKPAVAYLLALLLAIPAYRGIVRPGGEELSPDMLELPASLHTSTDGSYELEKRINELAYRLASASLLGDVQDGVSELADDLASISLSGSLREKISALGGGSVQSITLTCLRSANGRKLNRSDGTWAEVRFAYGEAVEGRAYFIKIEFEKPGDLLYEERSFSAFDDLGMGTLYLPIALLESGQYRLTILDTEARPPWNEQVHYFGLGD